MRNQPALDAPLLPERLLAAGKRRRRRVPTPEACYEECRRARGCAAFTYVLTQQHKPSEYACFLKQRGFEAGASYSGGTASGIVET